MEWKRRVHSERGTILVETFSRERADGRLIRNLEKKLAAHGVELTPLSRDRVFSILEDQGWVNPFIRPAGDLPAALQGQPTFPGGGRPTVPFP